MEVSKETIEGLFKIDPRDNNLFVNYSDVDVRYDAITTLNNAHQSGALSHSLYLTERQGGPDHIPLWAARVECGNYSAYVHSAPDSKAARAAGATAMIGMRGNVFRKIEAKAKAVGNAKKLLQDFRAHARPGSIPGVAKDAEELARDKLYEMQLVLSKDIDNRISELNAVAEERSDVDEIIADLKAKLAEMTFACEEQRNQLAVFRKRLDVEVANGITTGGRLIEVNNELSRLRAAYDAELKQREQDVVASRRAAEEVHEIKRQNAELEFRCDDLEDEVCTLLTCIESMDNGCDPTENEHQQLIRKVVKLEQALVEERKTNAALESTAKQFYPVIRVKNLKGDERAEVVFPTTRYRDLTRSDFSIIANGRLAASDDKVDVTMKLVYEVPRLTGGGRGIYENVPPDVRTKSCKILGPKSTPTTAICRVPFLGAKNDFKTKAGIGAVWSKYYHSAMPMLLSGKQSFVPTSFPSELCYENFWRWSPVGVKPLDYWGVRLFNGEDEITDFKEALKAHSYKGATSYANCPRTHFYGLHDGPCEWVSFDYRSTRTDMRGGEIQMSTTGCNVATTFVVDQDRSWHSLFNTHLMVLHGDQISLGQDGIGDFDKGTVMLCKHGYKLRPVSDIGEFGAHAVFPSVTVRGATLYSIPVRLDVPYSYIAPNPNQIVLISGEEKPIDPVLIRSREDPFVDVHVVDMAEDPPGYDKTCADCLSYGDVAIDRWNQEPIWCGGCNDWSWVCLNRSNPVLDELRTNFRVWHSRMKNRMETHPFGRLDCEWENSQLRGDEALIVDKMMSKQEVDALADFKTFVVDQLEDRYADTSSCVRYWHTVDCGCTDLEDDCPKSLLNPDPKPLVN